MQAIGCALPMYSADICREAARNATKTWHSGRQHGAHSTQIHCWHCVQCASIVVRYGGKITLGRTVYGCETRRP